MSTHPIKSLKRGFHLLQRIRSEVRDQASAGRNVMVRPQDIWLVSYPKSGNTWTRFLLAHLVYKGERIGFDNIEALVPDIYQHSEYHLQSMGSPRYLKSHEYFDPRYKRIILVVRDPRDIAVSYYYYKIKMGEDDGMSMSDFVSRFIDGALGTFGSWGENIGSWLGSRWGDHDVLLLRYEDMLEDTAAAIKKMARFLYIEVTEEEVLAVAEKCSFGSMRDLERTQGMHWKPLKQSRQDKMFIRSGKSGDWRTELRDDQAELISKSWKWQMEQLGYDIE